MKQNKLFFLGLFGLCLVLGLEYFTDIDIWLENQFYNSENKEWLINPAKHKELTIFFYDGLKRVIVIFLACCLLNMLLSIKIKSIRQYNHFCLVMLFSFILIAGLIAGAKSFTNVYCPYQLDIYNGLYPFVRILESYPDNFIQPKIGRCFPAGHATAGFAFLGLFYAFKKKSYRLWGLTCGLLLGWIAGIYQMLRGQHFLSHTLFSMIAALMLLIVVKKLTQKIEHKYPNLTISN